MPSFSCRDIDEICDWFFREDDAVKLFISSAEHFRESHGSFEQSFIDKFLEKKMMPSDFLASFTGIMRP